MVVHEHLHVTADHEHVEELFMHDFEMLDLPPVLRIAHGEFELGLPSRLERARQRTFRSTGNSTGSGMPALSFMPQREHTPSVFERMSGSIGHW